MTNTEHIAFACKAQRLYLGLTQKELAETTGIRQGDISDFERGKKDVQLCTLFRITKALGLTLKLEVEKNE